MMVVIEIPPVLQNSRFQPLKGPGVEVLTGFPIVTTGVSKSGLLSVNAGMQVLPPPPLPPAPPDPLLPLAPPDPPLPLAPLLPLAPPLFEPPLFAPPLPLAPLAPPLPLAPLEPASAKVHPPLTQRYPLPHSKSCAQADAVFFSSLGVQATQTNEPTTSHPNRRICIPHALQPSTFAACA